MEFESISGDAENRTTSRGISRRSVMKAGAAAAWSVPLVQVVAAAPAYAAVSNAAVLVFSTAATAAYSSNKKTINVAGTIKNTGVRTTQSLVVTVSFSDGVARTPDTAGWTPVASGPGPFTLAVSPQLATNATHAISAAFSTAIPETKTHKVTVTVTAHSAGTGDTDAVAAPPELTA